MDRHQRTRTPSGIPGALVTPRLPAPDGGPPEAPDPGAPRTDESVVPLPRRPTER